LARVFERRIIEATGPKSVDEMEPVAISIAAFGWTTEHLDRQGVMRSDGHRLRADDYFSARADGEAAALFRSQ
jgi:hypothetical protein